MKYDYSRGLQCKTNKTHGTCLCKCRPSNKGLHSYASFIFSFISDLSSVPRHIRPDSHPVKKAFDTADSTDGNVLIPKLAACKVHDILF